MKKTAAKAVKAKAAPAKKAPAKKAAAPAKKAVPSKKAAPVKASASKPAKTDLVDLSGFVTPLDDRLIVQMKDAERVTAGGLIIPDTVGDVSGNREGTVVSVGRGHRDPKGHLRPMDVRAGDRVVFTGHAGSKIRLLNHDLVILRESEVLGVVGPGGK